MEEVGVDVMELKGNQISLRLVIYRNKSGHCDPENGMCHTCKRLEKCGTFFGHTIYLFFRDFLWQLGTYINVQTAFWNPLLREGQPMQ